MARIRTVKPEVAVHELLYRIEQELKINVRFAWVMLPGHCDREGRFKWRPDPLKLGILPYDKIEFSRVLDAWLTRGMLVKYRVKNEWYGCIPTWKKHQAINNRESPSEIPSIEKADEVIDNTDQEDTDASSTRQARDDDASSTPLMHARGEGKGREGKGTRVDDASANADCPETNLNFEGAPDEIPLGLDLTAWERWRSYRISTRKPLKPVSLPAAQRQLAAFGSDQAAVVEQSIANGWQGLFALKSNGNGHGEKPKEGGSANGLPCLNP